MQRSAVLLQCLEDPLRVLGIQTRPNIQVLCRPNVTMRGQSVCANYQILTAVTSLLLDLHYGDLGTAAVYRAHNGSPEWPAKNN